MTLQDTANQAGAIAKASTDAALRATFIGIIPILEFGLLIAITLLVVAVPIKIIKKVI